MTSPPTINGLIYIGPLGSGGYADVYLYEQEMPRRKVAVKVMKLSRVDDAMRTLFTAEANAMAELADHPNIVPVFTADVAGDGRPYLVMMYYPRSNLGARAATERFAVSEVLRIGIQISSAVETAHRAGILHRDIKPANILTSQYGSPGLTDFGIAARTTGLVEDEDTGVSVPWSPPEILYASAPASVRSDIYALSATLWHLLVGRSPFEIPGGENSQYAVMRRIKDLPPPPTGRADVPASLDRLLRQAMAKDPSVRPAKAIDFARSLQAVEQEQRLPRTEIVVTLDEAVQTRAAASDHVDTEATRVRAPIRVDAQPQDPAQQTVTRRARVEREAIAPKAVAAPIETPAPRLGGGQVRPNVSIPPPESARLEVSYSDAPRSDAPRSEIAPSGAPRPRVARSRAPEIHERPVPPTLDRPQSISPDRSPAHAVASSGSRGVRLPVVLGIATLAVLSAVVVGLIVTSGHSGGHPQPKVNSSRIDTNQNAGVAGDAATTEPGKPVVTVSVVGSNLVVTWVVESSLPGDQYQWQESSGGSASGTTFAPSVTISDPAHQRICFIVRDARRGSHQLNWSDPKCSQ